MQQAWRIDPNALRPFNDAPNYLSGEVKDDGFDNLQICGHSQDQLQGWHNIGAKSVWLEPESFEIVASLISQKEVGACSIGIIDETERTRIAVSHFLRSSLSLDRKEFIPNYYSGFGRDDGGERSQSGLPAEWLGAGSHHNVMLRYDHDEGLLSCYANNVLVHWVYGRIGRFRFRAVVEAVGVDGDFDFRFERLMYRPLSKSDSPNLEALKCWLPEYSPTFLSYAHADKQDVDRIAKWLRAKGVRVMGDWDFRGGDSLIARIAKHISRASFLLVALSPSSVGSRWVSKELEIALNRNLSSENSLQIVPLLLVPCEVPSFLSGTLRFDLTATDQQGQLEKLLETLSFRTKW